MREQCVPGLKLNRAGLGTRLLLTVLKSMIHYLCRCSVLTGATCLMCSLKRRLGKRETCSDPRRSAHVPGNHRSIHLLTHFFSLPEPRCLILMRQVEKLIKNSPLPSAAASASSDVRTPLRETTVTDVSVMSDIIRAILHSLVTRMHLFSLVVVENDHSLKTG